MKSLLFLLICLPVVLISDVRAELREGPEELRTFCNPMDLSYRFQLTAPSRREAADPTIVWFKDRYYLFASMSSGYWHSKNLVEWEFLENHQIPTEEYAPCAVAVEDTLYFLASSNEKSTVYQSKDPMSGVWTVAKDELEQPVWDPAFFLDDDKRLYLFWGCSNENPIYGVELSLKQDTQFDFLGRPSELIHQNPERLGWEVPGDYHSIVENKPWIEGPWVNKKHGCYYLQYAGPGTEYKSYSDSVYVSDKPLGPYSLQPHNPMAYKPEGFAAGAGHGSTFVGPHGNLWHIGTITISQKHVFERRLGLYPTFYADDGTLYSSTKYGDYPLIMPDREVESAEALFPGWMLLSYRKPVVTSSEVEGHPANQLVDEDIRSYWAAETGHAGEYATVDLVEACEVKAIQVNFAEHETQLLGREKGTVHRFTVEVSLDGKNWECVIDRSQNETDNTHCYFQLKSATICRYVKVSNIEVPDGSFALSGLRVFGNGSGAKPVAVHHFEVMRHPKDRRQVSLRWDKSENADGYVISYGVNPEQLFQSYMLYDQTSLTIRSLDAEQNYYFTIEAFNENGITRSGYCESAE